MQLPKEYKKEEIIDMLVMQHGFIKTFSVSNKMDEHVLVQAIKPLKNNPNCYKVFTKVNPVLRQHYDEKITLGLSTCKAYDRFHGKRFYNRQNSAQYAKEYTNTVIYCNCSEDHPTNQCSNLAKENV